VLRGMVQRYNLGWRYTKPPVILPQEGVRINP
jgi:hypothetical protein